MTILPALILSGCGYIPTSEIFLRWAERYRAEGLKLRLDMSAQLAQRVHGFDDPMALLDQAFGEAVSAETRASVSRAESKEQAFALLLMSPEFQRR